MKSKILGLALLVSLSACSLFDDAKEATSNMSSSVQLSSSSNAVHQNWIEIAETTSSAGLNVHLYALQDTLGTGYQPLRICLHNHNKPELSVADQKLMLMPWMTMMSKSHASPVEQPVLATTADGCTQGAVVFTMPSNDMEGWTLGVKLPTDSARFKFWVKNQDKVQMVKDPADTSKRVLIALASPRKWVIGSQEIEFAVFKKNTMMDFPADTSWSFNLIDPTMPSMGHGSPNNVIPVLSNGHYKGKVNFTMSGAWNIAVGLNRGTDSLKALSWDVTVP